MLKCQMWNLKAHPYESHVVPDLDSVEMETDNAFVGTSGTSAALNKPDSKESNKYLEQKIMQEGQVQTLHRNPDIAKSWAPHN